MNRAVRLVRDAIPVCVSVVIPILSLSITIISPACNKHAEQPSRFADQQLIEAAKAFINRTVFQSESKIDTVNYRARQTRQPEWDKAKVMQLSAGKAVVVPIHYTANLYLTTLATQ